MFSKMRVCLLLLLVGSGIGKAQNFNYTFSKTTETYVGLTDSSATKSNDVLGNVQIIPIGFNLNVAGSGFQNVTVNTNGSLIFDSILQHTFVVFLKDFYPQNGLTPSEFFIKRDSLNGSRTLKLEFKNIAFKDSGNNEIILSYQVLFKEENNVIEFHMGSINGMTVAQPCIIGLLNSYDAQNNPLGFLLNGDPSNPEASLCPANSNALLLSSIPVTSTKYIFSFENN